MSAKKDLLSKNQAFLAYSKAPICSKNFVNFQSQTINFMGTDVILK